MCPHRMRRLVAPISVQKKLDQHHLHYNTAQDFAEDVRLIWHNCKLYNGQNHGLSQIANELEQLFESKFQAVLDRYGKVGAAGVRRRRQPCTYPRSVLCFSCALWEQKGSCPPKKTRPAPECPLQGTQARAGTGAARVGGAARTTAHATKDTALDPSLNGTPPQLGVTLWVTLGELEPRALYYISHIRCGSWERLSVTHCRRRCERDAEGQRQHL